MQIAQLLCGILRVCVGVSAGLGSSAWGDCSALRVIQRIQLHVAKQTLWQLVVFSALDHKPKVNHHVLKILLL